jgi:hypothetical protein
MAVCDGTCKDCTKKDCVGCDYLSCDECRFDGKECKPTQEDYNRSSFRELYVALYRGKP